MRINEFPIKAVDLLLHMPAQIQKIETVCLASVYLLISCYQITSTYNHKPIYLWHLFQFGRALSLLPHTASIAWCYMCTYAYVIVKARVCMYVYVQMRKPNIDVY